MFIIPGIYLYIRVIFWNYLIIEEKCPPFKAIQLSWKRTKKQEIQLLKWVATLIIIKIIGILGFIITTPLTIYTEYYIYRKFKYGKQKEHL
ncbi:MAG TPA: hypothetical protein VKS21_07650 [Spirochaetota bacterium]|nr:hypothetical protein [Spirochaetota bacterium]